jgi:type I restriction enzyme S subunit
MNTKQKKALMPKLRFPEFRETGEWSCEKTDHLVDTVTPPKKLPTSSYGLVGKFPIIDQSQSEVCGWTDDSDALVHEGLPLIIFGDHTCALKFVSQPFAQGADGIKILKSRAKIAASYLYQYLNYQPVVTEEYKRHYSILKEKLVLFPQHISGEQQKIADCLSSLDELIAAQARKVEALKTHKKGLMQQLLPREGETQPRLRFPEFQNTGEWESKLLGDVVKSFKTGKLDANAMVEGGQYRFYTCAKNYYQIDRYAFEGEALLVAGNGAHLGYIHHYIGKFNAYQRTYVLQQFETNVVFLRYLLDRYLPARIQFEKKDGNTPYIVLSTLTEMPLVIPINPDEQKRIAICLRSLDSLIAAATEELGTLKHHKEGLMQQLFPNLEDQK